MPTEIFEAKAARLYSFSVTPGKLCLTPKVLLGGYGILLLSILDEYGGLVYLLKAFFANRDFRGQSCSALLIFRNPRKAMFDPKSASRGVTGSYCWVWVWGIGVFAKTFFLNRDLRSRSCSALLIFRNPRTAMFGPESASWGVTGSWFEKKMSETETLVEGWQGNKDI